MATALNKIFTTESQDSERVSVIKNNKKTIDYPVRIIQPENIWGSIIGTEEKTKKGRPRIDDDVILNILEDVESGNLSYKEISEKYKVSTSSISKYVNLYFDDDKKPKTGIHKHKKSNQVIVQKDVNSKDEKLNIDDKENNYIFNDLTIGESELVVGMTYSNTEYEVEKTIFGKNYKYTSIDDQEKFVEEFIKQNITFKDGIPEKDLVIYSCGWLRASIIITKVCSRMKVNLTFIHNKNGKADKQIVFDQFESSNKKYQKLRKFISSKGTTRMCNSNVEDFINAGTFFVLTETDFNTHSKYETVDTVLFKDYSDVCQYYHEKIKNILDVSIINKDIIVDEYTNFSTNECSMSRNIMRASNY